MATKCTENRLKLIFTILFFQRWPNAHFCKRRLSSWYWGEQISAKLRISSYQSRVIGSNFIQHSYYRNKLKMRLGKNLDIIETWVKEKFKTTVNTGRIVCIPNQKRLVLEINSGHECRYLRHRQTRYISMKVRMDLTVRQCTFYHQKKTPTTTVWVPGY